MPLSLKWKVIIIFGLVLVSVHGILSGLTIITLNRQFQRQRADAQARHANTINLLISQSSRMIQQIAETIPLVSEKTTDINNDRIIATLNHYWNTLQLTWGIEGIQYFDTSGSLISLWGSDTTTQHAQAGKILATENPVYFIECAHTCLQYVGIPILDDDGSTKALIVSKNLADIVLDFLTITHAQIGILAPGPKSPNINKLWGKNLVAITNPKENINILRSAENIFSLDSLSESKKLFHTKDKIYEIMTFKTEDNEIRGSPTLIVIDDITELYLSQRQNITNYIAGGGFSLATGMILLVFLLKRPLRRVTDLSRALPMLADGDYSIVQEKLGHLRHRTFGTDEIDNLEKSALHLGYKLKSMQSQIEQRTQVLVKQSQTLESERNFIQELLDSAPLIILTQDRLGSIITMNRYGKKFAIKAGLELHNYDQAFINATEDPKIKSSLFYLRNGKLLKAQFESKLPIDTNHSRYITWFHTRLNNKNFNSPLILSIGLDITDRKIAERRLTWLADHDPLTQLYNRRKFEFELEKILHKSLKLNHSGAILYFDLDQFKYINDTCGHKSGDALLKAISDKIKNLTRSTDLLARLGGDEFALVIQNVNQDGAAQIAEKIFNCIRSLDYKVDGQPFKITVSVGIAMFPEHGHNIQDLLANADLAMYQSKESGRGRIHIYSAKSDFQHKLKTQIYWKDQIEQALLHDRFMLYFQPILDIEKGTISHYETLLRMLDDQGNVVSPNQFIPVAEQVGLISQIDYMVVKKALDTHISLVNKGLNLVLSINLSGQALADLDLQKSICRLLNDDKIDPSLIIFEITETIAVSNFTSAQKLMKDIKTMGSKFAIDDFGVGFSSFYYLIHLPVDYVKIDGSFIKRITTSKEDQVLVQALADIARGLGKKTIAEFVENEEILIKLKEYGIHYAQGFHIGKPLPYVTIPGSKVMEK